MKATIWDVAREAGVSIASVSNALTGKKKVSDETRRKIDEAATRLGYTADPAASSLKTRSSHIIGLIVPSIDSAFFPAVISGLQAILEENGYIINFYSTGFNEKVEQKYVDTLLSSRADGIILDSVSLDRGFLESMASLGNAKKRVPVVALERDLTDCGLTSVFADNYRGGRLAAAHLAACGVKRPAHIYGLADAPWSAERLDGFRDGLAEAGIELMNEYIRGGDFTIQGGALAAHSLLAEGREPDGIFASNDLSAAGAMQSLAEFGRRIPDDTALIGFDNTYVTSLTTPTISTINVPKQRLGEEAGKAVLGLIEHGGGVEKIELPVTLIERESTGGRMRREI